MGENPQMGKGVTYSRQRIKSRMTGASRLRENISAISSLYFECFQRLEVHQFTSLLYYWAIHIV